MIAAESHENIPFEQNIWLKNYTNLNAQKQNKAKNKFGKNFYKIHNIAFLGKTMENVRKCIRLGLYKKDDTKIIVIQQSIKNFNGIHQSYGNFGSFTLKQNEILMYKLIYLEFAILKLSNLHMYEAYYDKLQLYFGQEKIQLHYVDTDTFDSSVQTQDNFEDLKNMENIFNFSDVDDSHE